MHVRPLLCFAVCVLLTGARADWVRVGDARAEGDAKEFRASGRASTARIICKEGSVIINTLVVREGSDRHSIRVTRRLQAGEQVEVDLGGVRNVTGFRISDSGGGRYEVEMKQEKSRPVQKDRGGWTQVAELNAGGDAKEVAVNRHISAVRLEWISGRVGFNTMVVRDGSARRSVTVGRALGDGEHVELKLGSGENVSGLRISDSGRGRYRVLVR
jgi:hypothetical protein